MGLRAVDMTECNAKCRCTSGPNAGRLYNVDQPCPFGYAFDEENCDCPQPCDWCGDEEAEVGSDEYYGRCAILGGEEITSGDRRVTGFWVNVNGSADEYYGAGSLLGSGCGRATVGSKVKFVQRVNNYYGAARGICPGTDDQDFACKNFGLFYRPYLSFCGNTAFRNGLPTGLVLPGGGTIGPSGIVRTADDPNWDSSAWDQLWLVDLDLQPEQEEYWIGLLYESIPSRLGDLSASRGDVGYFIGEFTIEIECSYSAPEPS